MNGKKADKPRYWITYLPKELGEGSTFKPHMLHLTIIPWFVTAKDTSEVIEVFREKFSDVKTFKITVGDTAEFKSKRKIPVNLVSPVGKIVELHEKALQLFDSLESRWAVKSPYVAQSYIPHIRRRPGYNLTARDVLNFSSLSLVGADRRGDDVRTVLAKVDFK